MGQQHDIYNSKQMMGRTDKQTKSQEQHKIKDQTRWIENNENEERTHSSWEGRAAIKPRYKDEGANFGIMSDVEKMQT